MPKNNNLNKRFFIIAFIVFNIMLTSIPSISSETPSTTELLGQINSLSSKIDSLSQNITNVEINAESADKSFTQLKADLTDFKTELTESGDSLSKSLKSAHKKIMHTILKSGVYFGFTSQIGEAIANLFLNQISSLLNFLKSEIFGEHDSDYIKSTLLDFESALNSLKDIKENQLKKFYETILLTELTLTLQNFENEIEKDNHLYLFKLKLIQLQTYYKLSNKISSCVKNKSCKDKLINEIEKKYNPEIANLLLTTECNRVCENQNTENIQKIDLALNILNKSTYEIDNINYCSLLNDVISTGNLINAQLLKINRQIFNGAPIYLGAIRKSISSSNKIFQEKRKDINYCSYESENVLTRLRFKYLNLSISTIAEVEGSYPFDIAEHCITKDIITNNDLKPDFLSYLQNNTQNEEQLKIDCKIYYSQTKALNSCNKLSSYKTEQQELFNQNQIIKSGDILEALQKYFIRLTQSADLRETQKQNKNSNKKGEINNLIETIQSKMNQLKREDCTMN